MTLDRRQALALMTAAAAGAPAAVDAKSTAKPAFAHGVASGDPLADRLVIWSRVSGAGDNECACSVAGRYRS